MNSQIKLDSFTRQYIETMLWSSEIEINGSPTDDNYSLEGFSDNTIKKIIEDCQEFQELAGDLICADNILRIFEGDMQKFFGHDFWLTRNREGTGFWNGGYKEPAATQLTKLARRFDELYLYVGDDGKLYL